MEHNPRNLSDEEAREESVEKDDDDKDEKKKSSRSRHVPLISVEKAEQAKESKPRPKISISDRLLESFGAKPTKDSGEKAEPKHENEPSSDEVDADDNKAESSIAEDPDEVASWESGDVVILNEAAEAVPEPSDVEESEPSEGKEFVDIPPAPEAIEDGDAEEDQIDPELVEDGLGGEGPPEPPEDEPDDAADGDPDPRRTPATSYSGGASYSRPWYDAAAADRERIHRQELEEAEYRGVKSGTRRGLGAGLLFGWMIGRHGKKKQAKGFEKELKSKDKDIKALKSEQIMAQQRIEAIKRTQEQLRSNIQHNESKPPQKPENKPQVPFESKIANKKPEKAIFTDLPEKSARKDIPKTVEAVVMAAAVKERLEAKKREAAPENQEITEETYQVASGRHVETSAWHRIEIDEKTGKAVANPEIAYGEEFKREQRQEIFSEDSATSGSGRGKKHSQSAGSGSGGSDSLAAAAGELAVSAGSESDEDKTYDSTTVQSGLASLPNSPVEDEPAAKTGFLKYASMPSIWVIAAVLVLALFLFGILR